MRLLFCIPGLWNAAGMERTLTKQVNYLANLPQFEITLVTTEQMGKPIRFPLHPDIRVVHMDIDFNAHFSFGLWQKWILHRQKIRLYEEKLTRLMLASNTDICISLCGKEIEFLEKMNVPCKKVAQHHFGINYHSQFMNARKNGPFWWILGKARSWQFKKSVKNLDKLIVLTRADKIQWEKTHNNVMQIPNPNPLTNQVVSNTESRRVLSIGRLEPQKGYDMLIEIWAMVHEKHPDWILEIYGTGDWEEELRRKINSFHLQNTIFLRGHVADVLPVYLSSSMYVMSSRYEGMAMVLIESMSCGLPVVAFDCACGPAEIITDGVNGFLIEEYNLKHFADKICFLIEHDQFRKEMGEKAHLHAKQYAIENIMGQMITLFETLHGTNVIHG